MPPASTESSEPLRVLVVDDPLLADAIQRQWQSRAESPLDLRQSTTADLRERKNLDADVMIYPSQLLGEMAERDLIIPLPAQMLDEQAFAWSDIFDLVRGREIAWGDKTYAVPLGATSYVLWYRPDIFSALNLTVPTTWKQYQETAERLGDRNWVGPLAGAADLPWSGTLEPLGSQAAADTFLAHAAALARHRSQYSTLFDFSSMEPLIAQPPFVQALEALSAIAKSAERSAVMSPLEVRQAYLRGECAMAITWPSRAAPQETVGSTPRLVQFAELPGSDRVYNIRDQKWETRRPEDLPVVPLLGVSGRVGSVTKESSRARTGVNILRLLCSTEWSTQIAPQSAATAPFRQSQEPQAGAWVDEGLESSAGHSYFAVLQATYTKPVHLMSLRIPGREEYLSALEEALRETLWSGRSAQESLESAAERWREITAERGQAVQRRAYRRSLGLEK